MNYNMHGLAKKLSELFVMLKTAEVEIKKEHTVLMVNKTVDFNKSDAKGKGRNWKSKKSGKGSANPKTNRSGPKPKPGVVCYYYKGDGHWKRNCTKYLADKKAGKFAAKKGICDIHILDVFLTSAWSHLDI